MKRNNTHTHTHTHTQASNWRALYEGISDTLDLPMAVKGFVFVSDVMYSNMEPKVRNVRTNVHEWMCTHVGVDLGFARHIMRTKERYL